MARFTHIVNTIDSHTAGAPTRIVVSGLPTLPGETMADRMLFARRELDDVRSWLMLEPRGRQDMYGAVLTTASDPAADFGLIFMNTLRYTGMCGHAVIGAATSVVETGMVQAVEPETALVFDTPTGLVRTSVRVQDGCAVEVSFVSTPVFVYRLGATLSDQDLGEMSADIVYSGGFFASVPGERVGLELIPSNATALAEVGAYLRDLANDQLSVAHPHLPYATLVEDVQFYDPVERRPDGALFARNTVTLGERTLDRSPCGTGTCARMAALYARGELRVGQPYISESIIGTRFIGRILEETRVGEYSAICVEIAGRAFVTGFHQFVLDPDDVFPRGFSLPGDSVAVNVD